MVSTTVEIDANGMIELPEEMLKELKAAGLYRA